MLTVGLLGFSSGLPLLLVLSTLSLWLKDEGISKAAIGLFALVKTPYNFKFLWSPIIDRLPLPIITKLFGRRRGWALVTQVFLMVAIFAMALTNPAKAPYYTALFAVFVAFCSASQDIVIDAYRVELLEDDEQGAGSGMITLGYRIGMLVSGAGALYLAEFFENGGSSVLASMEEYLGVGLNAWNATYIIMAFAVLVGIITVLFSREPKSVELEPVENQSFIKSAFLSPLLDFAKRPNWVLILLFVMLYKLPDAYMGPMVMPFYDDLGFLKSEIAKISKLYGMFATIIGGILGGIIVNRYGIIKSLIGCGILQGLTNLMFAYLATVGHDTNVLAVTITLENLAGGMSITAFVAYLSSLCTVAFTATQYALLSSLMGFSRDVVSATSGKLAEMVSWETFFIITTLMSVPGLLLLLYMIKKYPVEK
jgi:PAT family beta-lactamase induction signal transducer AmpG